MNIKTVILIRASMKKTVVEAAQTIDTILCSRGITVLHLYGPYDVLQDPVLPNKSIDVAFAIGGDGTVLKAARICAARNIPILPIKVGHFGFINDIQCDEWHHAFIRCLNDTLEYEDHMLLSVRVEDKMWYALNDITLQSVVYGTIRTRVYCNEEFLTDYRSDGIIISTPIGSTAHSLSVGGPVLVPGMRIMMINPIAPFTLTHRPIIFPSKYSVSISLDNNQRTQACLIADGRIVLTMLSGSSFHIEDSNYLARIFKSPHRSYFEVLRDKLKWAGTL